MKLFAVKVQIVLALFTTLILSSQQTFAQKKVRRCATMEAIEERLKTDPIFKADYEAKNRDIDAYLAAHPLPPTLDAFPSDTITIPVVVHIVLPDPYRVTDEDVQRFIDRLNEDYSGFNDDSATASGFYSVRGHSMMRFALARRDPSGKSTTGIERKVGNVQIAQTTAQNIKVVASGGLAAWTTSAYYNLWVGSGFSTTGLLGISPQIGVGATSGSGSDGVCVDEQVFASNPCYTDPSFNLARTAVHEIGHNFGLNHTFQGGCTSGDFTSNLTSGTLAAAFLGAIDDTPPLSTATSGCPATGTTNGCTPAVAKMFQNYMDYSNDQCMSLFTKGQVKRMHQVILQYRSGYLTTKGHLPPNGTPQNEVRALELISPGGSEYDQDNCKTVSFSTPTCGTSPSITPRIKISNSGINKLTSLTISASVNGNILSTQTYPIDLIGGRNTTLTLPSIQLVGGNNILKVFTSNPNSALDSLPLNDTITKNIFIDNSVPTPTALPHFEGFEGAAFAPTANGWSVVNNNASTTTWARSTNAFKTGTASAFMQMFGYTSVGDLDYLKSPRFNFNNTPDSVFLTFDYAYKLKSNASNSKRDTLSVEVSTDCDAATWTQLWKKAGDNLKTSTAVSSTSWTAVAADWITTPVKISLMNYRNTPINLAFRTKNGNGQNIYIDNINIYSVPVLPLKLLSFAVQQNTRNITCKWETKKEDGVKNYEIERSIDGKNFEKIGVVNAIGNSNNSAFYQFSDDNAYKQNTNNLYYRLKMNDNNGKYTYSNIVALKIGEKQAVNLYPNPAKEFVNIQITSSANTATNNTIQIIDYLGRVIMDKKVIVATGTQSFEINTSTLPKANYMVLIKNESEIKAFKFIKE
ncbi:MAG: M43 family zinc metalloprotease [Bacteroidetes bacterium]|nr:M43 family zinc metalloprotease [Bacteroidota bacterium]